MAAQDPETALSDRILDEVVEFYLGSGDFNGYALGRLALKVGAGASDVRAAVGELVRAGQASIASGDWGGNPFIKTGRAPVEVQLAALGESGADAQVLVYPEQNAVERRIDVSVYDDRPFTRMLVMGEPQLAVLGFELNVIEPYVDDPRYEFPFWGNGGRISVREGYSDQVPDEARVSLRFGAGYGSDGRRVVVAHLWDLHELPATLQRIWHEHRALGKCEMDADYYRKTFLAEPSENVSIYEAFLQLQVEINSVLDVMGMQALFRATYEPGRGPRAFGFFIRPTRKAYLEFVQELDKLLSDNLDRRFFGDVEQYEDIPLKDGHVERRQKGTLRLLEEWLMARFRDVPKERIASIMQPLRGVRGERMKPAHAIVDDEYDLAYHDQQKEWIEKLYDALKELRALLRTDSGAVAYEPPWWEDELGVKTY